MPIQRKEFTGCTALIYDGEGNLLANTKVKEHHEDENAIEVSPPPAIAAGELCDLVILTAPHPYTYKGRIHRRGGHTVITLFQGGEAENRQETRYKLDLPASIEDMVSNGKAYPLHNMVETRLVNISRSGLRIRADYNALHDGDSFRIRIKAGENDKLLTAAVVYRNDAPPEYSEFGCRLVEEDMI